MKKNDVFTANITDINNLGFGVCRVDGTVVFVSGAVIGDKVEAKVIKCAKSYYVARTNKIVIPSPFRAAKGSGEFDAICNVSGKCGGCVYNVLTREKELELKREHVIGEMKKAGLVPDVEKVLTDGKYIRYRNKAQYPVASDDKGALYAGFFASGTHRVVKCNDCMLEPELFSEILETTLHILSEAGCEAYDEITGRGLVRHIYLRYAEQTGEVMMSVVINGLSLPKEEYITERLISTFPIIKSLYVNLNLEKTNVINGREWRLLYGKPYITDVLCGNTINLSPDSFYQVNRGCAELLYNTAFSLLDFSGNETLLDLYCGAGTISLAAMRYKKPPCKAIGFEIVESAVKNARQNARQNGIENTEYICADASDIKEILSNRGISCDAVILDPPRKGCSRAVLDYLCEINPPKICYISCAPDTLARDLAIMTKSGYSCSKVYPVDMFPRTGHVETVCLLSKK